MRRILAEQLRACQHLGTTSAYAENTFMDPLDDVTNGNYLRVRGEYWDRDATYATETELPPRARRILQRILAGRLQRGTTSACAENTKTNVLNPNKTGNYLRVRGEYRTIQLKPLRIRELPPRARRILRKPLSFGIKIGTTSACAENTAETIEFWNQNRNYLRVRGEYQ